VSSGSGASRSGLKKCSEPGLVPIALAPPELGQDSSAGRAAESPAPSRAVRAPEWPARHAAADEIIAEIDPFAGPQSGSGEAVRRGRKRKVDSGKPGHGGGGLLSATSILTHRGGYGIGSTSNV
jgi:hypothetical protein